MTISEKVAYLKGLAEGMKLDTEESKEGKLISVMIGILEEVGLSIEDMEDNMEAMGEEIDAISDGRVPQLRRLPGHRRGRAGGRHRGVPQLQGQVCHRRGRLRG